MMRPNEPLDLQRVCVGLRSSSKGQSSKILRQNYQKQCVWHHSSHGHPFMYKLKLCIIKVKCLKQKCILGEGGRRLQDVIVEWQKCMIFHLN